MNRSAESKGVVSVRHSGYCYARHDGVARDGRPFPGTCRKGETGGSFSSVESLNAAFVVTEQPE